MDDERFAVFFRGLGDGSTRRRVLAAVTGLAGLHLSGVTAKRRNRRNRRNRQRSHTGRVSAEITDGTRDGDGHPHVGLMVAQDSEGKPLWRCSGTLLSPTLFLTAGHCTAADGDEVPAHVEIWFAADVESGIPANGYPNTGDVGGTPFTHPQYTPDAFRRFDLGVVVLDEAYVASAYGALPDLDQLDVLATQRGLHDITFTAVGYGLQKSFPDAASEKDQAELVRMVASPHLVQLNTARTGDFSVLLSNNAHTGGICFGDSGGPNFIGDSQVLAGVSSYGQQYTCAGYGGVYRVDRADDLDWLYGTFGDHLP